MKQLTGPELAARLAAPGEAASPPWCLLDVREPQEVLAASIQIEGVKAVHIPMGQIPAHLAQLDPSQPTVCICHHGMRSAQVVAFLEHHGFESAYNLAGGIDAWSVHVDTNVPRY